MFLTACAGCVIVVYDRPQIVYSRGGTNDIAGTWYGGGTNISLTPTLKLSYR
jgi:hypothetical protein